MTNPDTSPGAQPGTETVNAAPASAEPQEPQSPPSFEDYSADDLLTVISGQTPTNEAPPAQPAEPAEPQPPAAPANDATPPAEPATEAGGAKPPSRLSVRALPAEQQLETAQAIDMVRKGEAADILEALQVIRGGSQPAPQDPPAAQPDAAPAVAPPVQTPPPSQDVASITSEIAELRAKRAQAHTEFDTDQETALTEQIEDAIIRLNDAKVIAYQQQQRQADAQVSYEQQYESAVVEMEERFPDVLNDDSAFTRILEDKVTAAQARKDPSLSDPRFIVKFAEEVADMLGASKQPAAPPARSVPAPPAIPRRGTAADIAPTTQVPRHTVDQAKAALEDADPETILAALLATA